MEKNILVMNVLGLIINVVFILLNIYFIYNLGVMRKIDEVYFKRMEVMEFVI